MFLKHKIQVVLKRVRWGVFVLLRAVHVHPYGRVIGGLLQTFSCEVPDPALDCVGVINCRRLCFYFADLKLVVVKRPFNTYSRVRMCM